MSLNIAVTYLLRLPLVFFFHSFLDCPPNVSSAGEKKLLLVCLFLMAILHNSRNKHPICAQEDPGRLTELLSSVFTNTTFIRWTF